MRMTVLPDGRRAWSARASQSSSQRHDGHDAVDLDRTPVLPAVCALPTSAANHLERQAGCACMVHCEQRMGPERLPPRASSISSRQMQQAGRGEEGLHGEGAVSFAGPPHPRMPPPLLAGLASSTADDATRSNSVRGKTISRT